EDLLTYCNEQGLQNVLFVRFPHQNKDTEPEIAAVLSEMAEAHGYKFVDFSRAKEEAGIVMVEDYYNDEHLNARGARKFTSYFGNYLMSNYDIKGEYSEELKKSWEDSVEKTEEILTRAEQDIEDNLGRNYYELSVYLPKWLNV
ncbi:MAG: SGNH/GDSL hydrolase family protein, partial [Lachnospiraceae bacterium]|nr:SGNH/GDSL hydrolase family protein [Lachnospiraceae bacterium]